MSPGYRKRGLQCSIVIIMVLFAGFTILTQNVPISEMLKVNTISEMPKIYTGGSVERIVIVKYPTLTAALTAIDSAEADIFGQRIDPDNYSLVESYPNIKKQWVYDTEGYVLAINAGKYPLGNVHLRRAIAFAIDKMNITENIMGNLVDVADFLIPLNNPATPEFENGGLFYHANYSEAIKELAKAGMLDVDEDGMVEAPNGSEVNFTLIYPSEKEKMNAISQSIVKNLRMVGINVTASPKNIDTIQTGLENHSLDYTLALYHVVLPDFDPGWGLTTFHSMFREKYGENIANISDDQIDEAANTYLTSYVPTEMPNLAKQGLFVIRDVCPVIPLFFARWLSVYTDANFEGWLDERFAGAFSTWNPVTIKAREGKDNVLRVAVLPEFFENFFTSLNPFRSGAFLNANWLWKQRFNPYLLVYDTPIATLPDGSAVPRAAISWRAVLPGMAPELGRNESRAEFTCDAFANFTDGTSLNAQDIRFTFELYRNHSLIPTAGAVVGFKVTGNYVAGITISGIDAFIDRKFGMLPILPRHIWSGKDPLSWEPTIDEAIGSGPFLFQDFVPGESLVLVANQGYYPVVDTEPPVLISMSLSPENPIPAESVTVRVYVKDRNPIKNVTLTYKFNRGTVNFTETIELNPTATGFVGVIPAHITASFVEFNITAADVWGNSAIIATGSYYEKIATEPTFFERYGLFLGGGLVLFAIVIVFFVKQRR